MSKLALTALILSLTTSAFAADLVLTVSGHQVINYKKVSKTRFEKISSVNVGEQSLDLISTRGTKNLSKEAINLEDTSSKEALEVTGRNIVRIEDEKEKVFKEVQAEVDRSILGNIKSINIDGATMESVYGEALKREGLNLLKSVSILNGAIKSKIEISALSCKADKDILSCSQDSSLRFSISGM